MRSLQLSFQNSRASFHFALESSRSGSVLGSGICARAAKLRFALINSRISGGNFRRSEDAGTSRSFSSTTVSDVVGKSTYGKVNLVCRRDVMGMLLRFGVSIFSSAVDTLFQLVILRMGIGLPPSGGPILI
ncbi:hypothetical protein EVAR_98283_1 [Eumeta japonica]|uniref:Uncharacterized protein n=1 Tax=Eumeta variegata TaxID=151549 RepID=A0A4C1XDP3_EUMVA|nr:hypothetical protein EVAR_98283_1 [Eumeta japonica]